jgi:hypothetical protein
MRLFLILCISNWREFFTTAASNDVVHFAIVISVSERTNDPNFYLLERSLESVMQQTYTNYTIVVVGDSLKASSEDIVLKYLTKVSNITQNWVYRNLDYNNGEKYLYASRVPLLCNHHITQRRLPKQLQDTGNYW